jgi:hypothetical protein
VGDSVVVSAPTGAEMNVVISRVLDSTTYLVLGQK